MGRLGLGREGTGPDLVNGQKTGLLSKDAQGPQVSFLFGNLKYQRKALIFDIYCSRDRPQALYKI